MENVGVDQDFSNTEFRG